MIKNTMIIFIILLLVSILSNASYASDCLSTNQDNAILLKNVVFDPSKQSPVSEKTEFATSQYSTDNDEYYILQFKGNVLEEWKLDVKNTGAIFFGYVPNNAFIVRMNSSVRSQVEAMDIVQWIGTYQPAYKISPVFSTYSITNTTTTNAISGDVVKDIIVMLFDSKHNAQVTSEIEKLGGEIVDNGGDIMRVRIGTSKLSDIADISGVSWIEKYMQPVIFNDIAADIINVSYVRNTHGLTGSGQVVAVADTGLDTGVNDDSMHDDIEGRIVTLHAWWEDKGDNGSADYHGHGTHVAGSVLGNGSCSNGQYVGMAPMAKLVFQALQYDGDNPEYNGAFMTPMDLGSLFQEAYDDGANIHSNSWGSDDYSLSGDYTSSSQYVDRFMWDNEDMLIVFTAGNHGKNGKSTVSPPGTAKNALTVGASENLRLDKGSSADNINDIAIFSSKGPTNDERIKPDVVAPGTWIYSTASSLVSSDNYTYMSGTSMATPITAGAAALVRQYYVENESLTSPSAALLKATLINGAANMGHSTDEQGWGRVDIENSLFPPSTRKMFYHDSINLDTLESWNITYRVFNSSEPLCITIVWTDHPSATFVGKMLVNDLDLTVTGPDGSYYGNGGDNINNVERVEITSPTIGLYTITVNGTNVPEGPQPFAIVASGALSPDTYLPVMSNEFPSNNSYINNSTTNVSINITDSESGVNLSSVNMLINNNSVEFTNVSITNGYKIVNIASTPYDEGLVTVSINGSDNASNPLAFNWSFTIDTILPAVTITHPTRDHVIQVPAINLNITTNETCDIWYRHVNGTNSSEMRGVILNTTLQKLNDGHYNITAFARDLAGNLNSTMVNFTIFATPPTISAPVAGEIFYISQNTTYVNGTTTTTIVTNVSVYVNGILVNESYPVIGGMFNISGVPLVSGINAINVTAIYNDMLQDYFSINTSLTVSVGGGSSGNCYKEIIINHSYVNGSQTNFPMMINIIDPDLISKAQSGGNDIIFVSNDHTTQLDHEIESYNHSTGQLVAWVRIPLLFDTTDTVINMYYNDSSAINTENPSGVWGENASGIWLMDEGTGTAVNDSSGNGNHGVNYGADWINGGLDFDGLSDSVEVSAFSPDIVATKAYTMMYSLNTVESAELWTDRHMFVYDGYDGFGTVHDENGNIVVYTMGGNTLTGFDAGTPINDGQLHTVVAVFDQINDIICVYVDGTLDYQVTSYADKSSTTDAKMYIGHYGSDYYDGYMKNVCIYDRALSAEEVSTRYNNTNSSSTFSAMGVEQTSDTTDTTPPVSDPVFVNITIDGDKSITFANHSDSTTEGNWISLRGGDPIKLPSPFTLTYNGTNFSSSTNGRINVTVDVEDNTDYIVTYPHTTHDMFTNVNGKNNVSMCFNGTTYFANNSTDVYLVKISRTSLKDAFTNITDGNFVGFYNYLLGNPYETKLNEPLDARGDMNLNFSEVDAGDYAIFILLNNSDLNKLSILSATTFQVLDYDSNTNVLSPEVILGSTFNANITLTNAPTDTYKYIAMLVHESAYRAEMQIKFNGTRAGTNLTLNGVEIIQGYEVLGVGLSSVNMPTVLNKISNGIDPTNGCMENITSGNNTSIKFDTTGLNDGKYILLTGVYNSGDKLVAFDQCEILISTDITASVINSVILDPTNPNIGDDITVTVNVTDNVGVTSVTADDVFLSYTGVDNIWEGIITAIDGPHTVNVSASDAAGNTIYDETANYTTTVSTHPVILVESVTAARNGYAVTSIMVNNVTGLGSGNITITYNSSVVHVTNVTSGDGNALAVLDWNVDNSTGSVRILAHDGDTSNNGDVVFAHVTFHAVGEYPDSTSLEISSSELIDNTGYASIVHSVTNGTFSIIDNQPPVITNAIATPDIILNDNGRSRAPGTNVTVLNATVIDSGSGVMSVTVDLSSIGGLDTQVMERIDGTDVWTVATNAIDGINLTNELVVTATGKANNTNTSEIELTVLLRGDVVRDGTLNSADVLYMAKYLIGKESMPSLFVGDMSPDIGDDKITSADALYLAKFLKGYEAEP